MQYQQHSSAHSPSMTPDSFAPRPLRQPIHVPDPARGQASQLAQFMAFARERTGLALPDWAALHAWSVRDWRRFWQLFALWTADCLAWQGVMEPVCTGDSPASARFFPSASVDVCETLLGLRLADAHAPALVARHADGQRIAWNRGELRQRVLELAAALRGLGVGPGDRIAAVLRNDEQAVLLGLAAMATGATLATAAPDMAAQAVLERFAALQPQVLLAHCAARMGDTGEPVARRVGRIAGGLHGLRCLVALDGWPQETPAGLPVHAVEALPWQMADAHSMHLPFNHPLAILFSSGTTGQPKCIVHAAGGVLLEHLKEHRLHGDLRAGDRLYFHTSCSWMMWNWQLSALATGAAIVTWDGPVDSVERLWRIVAEERVTVFGTSPPYLRMCEQAGLQPGRSFDLSALRAILSTGSVLQDGQYHWVRAAVGALPLQSIAGGTDILGCFVLGNPMLPVQVGQAQCISLGMDVQAWDDGRRTDGPGQLVCVNPFPSCPLGLHGDSDGSAFRAAYFAEHPGIWSHGDLVSLSPGAGARLHGRLDGVLNVHGIKVAPGAIEQVLTAHPAVREALVVQRAGDGCTVALLVLAPGASLDADLAAQLRTAVTRDLSASHAPDRLLAVPELPVTHNGKLSHAAARRALSGLPGTNTRALRNPQCLDVIRQHNDLTPPRLECPTEAPLPQRLQGLWDELFGIQGLPVDADFFRLGGNSLLAARLMARVRDWTGQLLPLSTLLQAATPARLAALLLQQPAAGVTGIGQLRAGRGTGLVLAPGLSGTLLECRHLVAQLSSSRPVWGLQAQGVDDGLPPLHDVQAMAARWVGALRAVQPQGPYALCGFSFGGLAVVEMARQLQASGQAVALLVLLDTHLVRDLGPLARTGSRLLRGARTLAALPPGLRGDWMRATLGRLVGRSSGPRPGDLPAPSGLSNGQRAVHAAALAAMAGYRPQPLAGVPLVYVQAAVPLGGQDDPLPVWRRVASAGLRVVRVPGTHLDLLGAQAAAVAAVLDSLLVQAGPAPGLTWRTASACP